MNVVTGYYGCKCHPFLSRAECKAAHNQEIPNGTPVRQRHTGRSGVIAEQCPEDGRGWVIVKYGEHPCDYELEHVACLIQFNGGKVPLDGNLSTK